MTPTSDLQPTPGTGSPDDARDQRIQNWSRHWHSGVHHSCSTSFGADYAGNIAAFWHRVFSAMAPGSRVLDIATGNGALPRLLLQARPAGDWHCDAIDQASLAPRWADASAPDAPLCFHTGVAAEALPFEDGRFALVVSQFGIEYSDLDSSIPELLRVLAPEGNLALVVHHADARPVQLAAIEIAHIDWLLSADGLVTTAFAMLEPLARSTTAAGRASLACDAAAELARERFNAAQDQLSARATAADGADVLFEAQDGIARLVQLALDQGSEPAQQAWTVLRQQLADARWRLADLRARALSPAQLAALAAQLQAARPGLVSSPLHERDFLMGWCLHSVPPA